MSRNGQERGLNPHIQADGGQDGDTVRRSVEVCGNAIGAGTALFWVHMTKRSLTACG